MRRDKTSNAILNEMVAKAIKEAAGHYPLDQISHEEMARKAYTRTSPPRRRELAISRQAMQIKAKLRRKVPPPPQPVIPGLLDEAAG